MSQEQKDYWRAWIAEYERVSGYNLGDDVARQSAAGRADREHPLSDEEQGAVNAWLLFKYPTLGGKEDPHPKGRSLFDDLPRVG